MMITPIIKTFTVLCEDWGESEFDFWVTIQADIGPSDSQGSETFSFSAVSIERLSKVLMDGKVEIGRSLFIQKDYNLQEVRNTLEKLLNNCKAYEWKEVSMLISRYAKGEIG